MRQSFPNAISLLDAFSMKQKMQSENEELHVTILILKCYSIMISNAV